MTETAYLDLIFVNTWPPTLHSNIILVNTRVVDDILAARCTRTCQHHVIPCMELGPRVAGVHPYDSVSSVSKDIGGNKAYQKS